MPFISLSCKETTRRLFVLRFMYLVSKCSYMKYKKDKWKIITLQNIYLCYTSIMHHVFRNIDTVVQCFIIYCMFVSLLDNCSNVINSSMIYGSFNYQQQDSWICVCELKDGEKQWWVPRINQSCLTNVGMSYYTVWTWMPLNTRLYSLHCGNIDQGAKWGQYC